MYLYKIALTYTVTHVDKCIYTHPYGALQNLQASDGCPLSAPVGQATNEIFMACDLLHGSFSAEPAQT